MPPAAKGGREKTTPGRGQVDLPICRSPSPGIFFLHSRRISHFSYIGPVFEKFFVFLKKKMLWLGGCPGWKLVDALRLSTETGIFVSANLMSLTEGL
jgi:hypothetical protein